MTVSFAGERQPASTRTRDISEAGVFLETLPAGVHAGSTLSVTLMDPDTAEVIEVVGIVARLVPVENSSLVAAGVRFIDVPPAWIGLARRLARHRDAASGPVRRRLRILVVGDDERRRGAMALYVTSGWDVRFACDLPTTREALAGFKVDAVVAEHDLDDGRWAPVLEEVRRQQPLARRVIRAALHGQTPPERGGPDDLVHQVVDVEAGLDAFVSAITEG